MNPAINQHSYEYTFWNQTPEIYQEYREPYRTTSVPFASDKEALWNLEQPIPQRDFRKDSQFVINLNGTAQSCTWQFHWAYSCRDKAIQTEPKADPRAFTGTQYKENIQWDYISVPMSWQVAQTFDQETGLYRRLYDAPMYIGDGVIFENYDKPRDAATLRVDPDTASVGTYRRTFQVPQTWANRESFICFNGVGTAFYVWVNGVYCGYGENRTAVSAFNITRALRPGAENQVVVEVYRNATGIYMEDQDMIRLSGIFRDVYLYSVHKSLSIRDFQAVPTLDSDYRDGALTIKAYLHSYDGTDLQNAQVTAALYDGKTLVAETSFSAEKGTVLSKEYLSSRGEETKFRFPYESELVLKAALPVTAPKHWNDETPNLYNLVLTVAQNGQVTEATGCKVGFRVLERKTAPWGKQYYTINGRRIFLYGVNRHEMWLDGGCWVSPEHHAQELAQIKALNINSIRTSHYTCDPTLYDYCDQYGIYLFAEANVETAGDIDDPSAPINKGPSENDFEDGGSGPQDIVGPEPTQEEKEKAIIQRLGLGQASEMQLRLEPALLDRQKANVIPNRNHPSVIIWSLCNEAGSGSPYIHMHQWVSNYEEESRIIFFKAEYEGNTISNLDYPSPTAMLNYLEGTDPRPLILSEFAWSEVHGRGGFSDSYVFQNDFVKNHINFLGMYLWSWKDMSLWAYGSDIGVEDKLKAAGIQRYLGYQGMFMKQLYGAQQGHFALGAFACNGVVTGSNEYKPDAAELKAAYGRIRVTPVDLARGILSAENRYSFRNLKDYLLKWSLTDGETSFASGEARIDLPAGQSFEDASLVYATKTLTLPQLAEAIASAPRVPGGELFVNLQFLQSAKLDWVQAEMSRPRGTIDGDMAYPGTVHIDPTLVSTLQLAVEATPAPTATPQGAVTLKATDALWEIQGGNTQWRIDPKTGLLSGCLHQGMPLLHSPLMPDFYAVICEQLGPQMGACRKTDWVRAVGDMQLLRIHHGAPQSGLVLVEAEFLLATSPESTMALRYAFFGDGQLFLTTTLSFAENLGTIPMLGFTTQLPQGYDRVKYLGNGPDENYLDRCHGATVGAYETTPEQMTYPYIYPCENGNRTECRWLTVTNAQGHGLLISQGAQPFQCTVQYHTAQQLFSEKKWSRSYYELSLPQYRTDTPVVRICHDVTGMGMGLATDFISHTIPSGKIYRYTFGLRPISGEGAYPTTREVTRLLQKSPIPDSLITGLMVDGTLADDFTPGTSCYTLETTRADYEALGQAALPKLELRTPARTDLREEALAVQGNLVRALRITAQSMGAQEQLTLRWILTEEKPVSTLPCSASNAALVTLDQTYYGGSLRSIHSSGRGPTFRQSETAHKRGVCLTAGQSAEEVWAAFDISAYTARGYCTLRGLCGIAPGQKRLNTHGFNIDFEVAELDFTIEADGRLCRQGRCVPNGDSLEICCPVGQANTLTLRVKLPKQGYFRDTALDFCHLVLEKDK